VRPGLTGRRKSKRKRPALGRASYDLCWRETRIAALRKEVHELRDQLNAEKLRSQVLKIKSDGDRR
jgi:hypothetical protein